MIEYKELTGVREQLVSKEKLKDSHKKYTVLLLLYLLSSSSLKYGSLKGTRFWLVFVTMNHIINKLLHTVSIACVVQCVTFWVAKTRSMSIIWL